MQIKKCAYALISLSLLFSPLCAYKTKRKRKDTTQVATNDPTKKNKPSFFSSLKEKVKSVFDAPSDRLRPPRSERLAALKAKSQKQKTA